ncbi:nucleotidyltransferase family protein [Clostridium sp. WILCCON 0269]|uniref:Nucleotidyltransferase family protein n=1 Tax=Candidatus Clostridium eludens TaxID=3381663 RepID=A0ABW8SS60_9CLOT
MNNNQRILVYLLSAAIRGKKFNNNEIDNVNWIRVFEMAKEQDIYTLLYPIIKDMDDKSRPQNDIMLEWKKSTILATLIQVQNIKKIGSLLRAFNEAEIQVMGLKGLVLRKLYPVKELRLMGDIDILIHRDDLDEAEKILLNLGYFEDHRDLKHIFFLHKHFLPIELHWLLFDMQINKNSNYVEKVIWENTEISNISGANLLIPSVENQILHLCVHMAWHFKYAGFGFRQLCDLVILVEAEGHKVNWNTFYEKVERCKIENFVVAIFEICRRMFNMIVPNKLNNKNLEISEHSEYIDMIIDNIFAGGVHGGIYGRSSLGLVDYNLLSYYESNRQSDSLKGKFKYMVGFLFPRSHRLSKRYNYAKEHPMFIPIAWMHRMMYGILRKDFSMEQKSLLLLSRSNFLRKRADLFKWLEL